jgi:hypothetical protein
MNVQIWNAENLSLTEMREFVQASQQIEFNGQGQQEIYAWVQQTLVEQEYFRQRRSSPALPKASDCDKARTGSTSPEIAAPGSGRAAEGFDNQAEVVRFSVESSAPRNS